MIEIGDVRLHRGEVLMCAASPGPHNGQGLFSSEAGLPPGSWRPDSQQPRHCLAERGPQGFLRPHPDFLLGWVRLTHRWPISPSPELPSRGVLEPTPTGLIACNHHVNLHKKILLGASLYLSHSWGVPGGPSWPATIHVFLPVAATGSLEGGFRL